MNTPRPGTVLCLSSFLKGQEFLRECGRLGARAVLLTVEKLKDEDWPRDSLGEFLYMPDLYHRESVLNAVSYLARSEPIARIVALDEFDLEMASALREHLRLPGLGETAVRFFRDKLAMRMQAQQEGIPVPDFVPLLQDELVHDFLERVPAPWILKPRFAASAIGIRKIHEPDELWRTVEELGDRRSFHLLERFVPGDVFHVDAIVWKGEIAFSEASGYVNPPFEVYHGGGLFGTRTLPRDSAEAVALHAVHRDLARALGAGSGALHSEFIHGKEGGRFYFLESAARVGGAFIAEMVEAATGVNLWREWARVEVALAHGEEYRPPSPRPGHAGLLVSLARQEWPDLSSYHDPEVVLRLPKRHHAGLVIASPDHARVRSLLTSYMPRFRVDFHASMPPAESATE